MISSVSSVSFGFYIILGIISSSELLRDYNLIVDKHECVPYNDYVQNVSCFVRKSLPFYQINTDFTVKKEIVDLRMDLTVLLERSNQETITLFRVIGVRACELFGPNIQHPVLKVYRDMVQTAGRLPDKCPIPVNFRFKFLNLTLNPEFLPPYLPEAVFKITSIAWDKRSKFLLTTNHGKIIYKKHKKLSRKH